MDELRENRGSSWRRFGRAQSELYRAIPRHGFCTVDLPRESAGYRSLFAGQPDEAVQHGFSRASQTFDIGRCQRSAQLAHLGRLGDIADPACTQTVLQRQLRCRSDQCGLRTGCDDHRPVSVAVSMGTVSHQQGGSDCIPSWICAAIFRLSSTSRMARPTKSTCWIPCPSRQGLST